MADEFEEQNAELLALKSIFDEDTVEIFGENASVTGRFIIDVEIPDGEEISLLVGSETTGAKSSVSVQYLSPLYLSFTLVPGYPSEAPPLANFHAHWLTPSFANRLRELLSNVWNENAGSPVLFNWYQAMKESIFDLIDRPLPLAECNAPVDQLVTALTDYDRLRKRRRFETSYFSCSVCCDEFLGSDCEQFSPCGHIFCRDCCHAYLSSQAREGAFDRMKCLAYDCKSPVTGQQLRSILGAEMYARYDQLSLSRGLDSMTDIVQCPRPSCGAPVLTDGPGSNMACCAVCQLPFCLDCKKVFHGVAPCSFSIRDKKRIIEEYKTAVGAEKAKMERKYGKEMLQRLLDELMSETWVKDNSKSCPQCRMAIEKTDGCNKMSCSKCGAYFCWLCHRILNDGDPYKHFNDRKAPCFNKLFAGVQMGDEDEEWFLR